MQELAELGAKPKPGKTAIEFDGDVPEACYRMQSAVKVLEFLGRCKVSYDVNETLQAIEKLVAKTRLELKGSFRVMCKRIGKHQFSGQDIAPGAGEYILNKTGASVSLEEPDQIVYIYIHEKDCYMGIDYSGFDLSKRDFKVFVHPSGLNSTVAYALFRMLQSKTIADPFCGSGAIPIEAALYFARKSPHFFKKDKFAMHRFMEIDLAKYDKDKPIKGRVFASDGLLKFVKATRDNAKLAGVPVDVTRMDVDWIDTKMEEKAFDFVTHPPSPSKVHDEATVEKLYKEFFYQARYAVRKRIVLAVDKPELVKKTLEHFKIVREHCIMQGGKELAVLVLER